jgi:hypothetical protein
VGDGELLCFRGDGREAFRIVRVRTPTERDWRSYYELGRPPLRSEIGSSLDHMSLSMFMTAERAREVNAALRGKLGGFIARVELRGEYGIWFAETGKDAQHLCVWGRPPDLQRALLAAEPV